jgi:predicted DNA-binding transcriptional regulator AlpA
MAGFLDLLRESLEPMIAKALTQMSAASTSPPEAAAPPTPIYSAPKGVDLLPSEQTKAADLRVALQLGKIPENTGLLIDSKTFAALLNISTATLHRLQAQSALPAPVQIGHLKKWRLSEILEWIEADCPPQRVWVHKRRDASKNKGR